MRRRRWRSAFVLLIAVGILMIPTIASAGFSGPLFGLGTDGDGNVIVADAGQGVVRANGDLIAGLPGVTDVAASDQGWIWAITGHGDAKVYKVYPNDTVKEFADLGAYEETHNPHPTEVDSNPYSVVDLGGGEAVVADAGGNTLLKVTKHGKVKLIAVLPNELVSTANAKAIIEEAVDGSCNALPVWAPPEAHEICELPDMLPAEPVATSVAIGPNGDFYVGELKGFPAPTGESRVWRIRSNARNADCSISPLCSIAYDGFTSIVDLAFDGDTLNVAEMEEKSWFAAELAVFEGLPVGLDGGTISTCNDTCSVQHGGIQLLSAITVDGDGDLSYAQLFGPVTDTNP